MANSLPRDVATIIKKRVSDLADQEKYCQMARPEAGAFMDKLVSADLIGGIISQYMSKAEVRTYIKDGVLNAYSKAYARKSKPSDLSSVVSDVYGVAAVSVAKQFDVEMFAVAGLEHPAYVLASSGTFLKWETALRKLLSCLTTRPDDFTLFQNGLLAILLAQGKKITQAEKDVVRRAFERCGARIHIVGE
jgi:hypothetical protein